MSELLFKICGLALISAMLILLLKRWGGDQAALLRVASGIVLATVCFSAASPLIEYARELSESVGDAMLSESVTLMLRVLAVAVVTHVCSGICRDCGEGAIGNYVEIGGRVEIVILSLPMIKSIIDLAVEMI